ALEAVHAAEAALAQQEGAAGAGAARRTAALEQATARGVPPDAAAVRRRADELAGTNPGQRDYQRWEGKHLQTGAVLATAARQLATALHDRGAGTASSLAAALDLYLRACAERAAIAPVAAQRGGLESQLAVREAAEHAVREAQARRQQAEAGVQAAAAACG